MDQQTGVSGVYSCGTKWGIKFNDVPAGTIAITEYRDEARARDRYAKARAYYQSVAPDEPEKWPELVAARMHWQVQK